MGVFAGCLVFEIKYFCYCLNCRLNITIMELSYILPVLIAELMCLGIKGRKYLTPEVTRQLANADA